jgi:hypothetical protein
MVFLASGLPFWPSSVFSSEILQVFWLTQIFKKQHSFSGAEMKWWCLL